MQWTPQNPSSSVNVMYPPLLSPNHYPGGATYSFTADFRPPAGPSQTMGSMMDSMKISPASPPRSFYQSNLSYSPARSPNYGQVSKTSFLLWYLDFLFIYPYPILFYSCQRLEVLKAVSATTKKTAMTTISLIRNQISADFVAKHTPDQVH